jgi:hypothetical protein
MDAGLIGRIENGAERGAAALFAAAVAYAVYGLALAVGAEAPAALGAAAAGTLAYWPCSIALAARSGASFALPAFGLRAFGFSEPGEELLLTERVAPDELLLTDRLAPTGELVLTEADRVGAPLVLDDILAELGPDARVVRLFDRTAMTAAPTPGQLRSRIAGYLRDEAPLYAPPDGPTPADASQALSAALAELRRSLR